MTSLAKAPQDKPLKIVAVHGGEGVRRRLFALGFHINDLIERSTQGLFGGPVLVKNITSETSVALGRGIAQKIMVEVMDGQE